MSNILNQGESLSVGQFLQSTNQLFKLIMQTDGNLVEYVISSSVGLWSSGTAGPTSTYTLTLRSDGNLVIFRRSTIIWATGTGGIGVQPYQLVMQEDGNIVLYDGDNTSIWTTDTTFNTNVVGKIVGAWSDMNILSADIDGLTNPKLPSPITVPIDSSSVQVSGNDVLTIATDPIGNNIDSSSIKVSGNNVLTTVSTITRSQLASGTNNAVVINNGSGVMTDTTSLADSFLATISTAGKVANSATTATSSNTNSAIVARDSSGNFTAGTITATLNGTATNFSGSLSGDVTGTQSATSITNLVRSKLASGAVNAVVVNNGSGVMIDTGGSGLADSYLQTISTAGKVDNSATTATDINTPSAIVARDGSGDFSAGTITATLNGSATDATNFTGSLSGDVTGTQSATSISNLDRSKLASGTDNAVVINDGSGVMTDTGGSGLADTYLQTITTAGKVDNSATTATDGNSPSTIVARDGSGDFSAGTITATLNGSATNFSGSLSGDVTGTQSATSITNLARSKLAVGTNNAVVINNGSGVMIDTTSLADSFLATISTAGKVANSATTATSSNTNSAIVTRDGSGNFAAGTITAILNGTATNFSGSLSGDVTGTQSATSITNLARSKLAAGTNNAVVINNGSGVMTDTTSLADSFLATISAAGKVANSATTATASSTNSTIMLRDGSSNTALNRLAANRVTFGGATTYLDNPSDVETINMVNNGNATFTADSKGFHLSTALYRAQTTTQTTDYTLVTADDTVPFDATTTNLACTIPRASLSTGREITIVKVDSGANTVTISATGGSNIGTSATYVLNTQAQTVRVLAIGSSDFWAVIGQS